MTEAIVAPARNGNLTANVGPTRIHSAYDPRHEAAKFLVAQINSFPRNGVIIIVGAGLGYLDDYLSSKREDIKIISCHLIANLYHNRVNKDSTVLRWNPSQNIEKFLFNTIKEMELPRLHIIEWPASIQASPAMAKKVWDALALVIRRYAGNITTTAAFGRLWIQNSIRNYLEFDRIAALMRIQGATVITASGPSLELHLRFLKQHRRRYHLWALPSSLPALARAEIKPDLVFSTDPGHWARLHGRYFPEGTPVVMPFSACPLPPQAGVPILLAQNSIGESSLLNNDDWPTIKVPQTGSVAITAVEVWHRICDGPLILAGLDLCWFDLRGHVRPHGFDGWFAKSVDRTKPMTTTLWEIANKAVPKRHGLFRTGFSLTTYADWFNSTHFKKPIYRLSTQNQYPYPKHLQGIRETDESIFKNLQKIRSGSHEIRHAPINSRKRKQNVCNVLRKWHQASIESGTLKTDDIELFYALDPGSMLTGIRSGMKEDWQKNQHTASEILASLLQTYAR